MAARWVRKLARQVAGDYDVVPIDRECERAESISAPMISGFHGGTGNGGRGFCSGPGTDDNCAAVSGGVSLGAFLRGGMGTV